MNYLYKKENTSTLEINKLYLDLTTLSHQTDGTKNTIKQKQK